MKSIIILVIGFITLFCCCHEDDLLKKNDQLVPLTLFADTSHELSRYGVPLPDAGNIQKIGLIICNYKNQPYRGKLEYIGVKATLENGKWITDTPIQLNSEIATIYAYYPDTLNLTDLKAIPVNSRNMDLLLAKCTGIDNQNPNAILKMEHAFAKIKLRMFYMGYDTGYQTATFVAISNVNQASNFGTSGTLDIFSGNLEATGLNAKSFLDPGKKYELYDFPDPENYMEMLVFPAKFSGNEIKITIRFIKQTTSAFVLDAGEWLPGTVNKYTLMVNP